MNTPLLAGLAFVLLAACTSSPSQQLDPVPFRATKTFFDNGDKIEIDSVSVLGGAFRPGAEIEVRGRYWLASRQRARLCFGLTNGDLSGDNWQEVQRGAGEFELSARMISPGTPHVAMYSGDAAYNRIANLDFEVDRKSR